MIGMYWICIAIVYMSHQMEILNGLLSDKIGEIITRKLYKGSPECDTNLISCVMSFYGVTITIVAIHALDGMRSALVWELSNVSTYL